MEIEAEGDSTDGEDIEMDCATVREPVEAPAVSPVCVVLDAANIGWSMSKNAEFDAVGVVAALHFFKSRGLRCFGFAPAYYVRRKAAVRGGNSVMETDSVSALKELVASDDIVLTPPQADDDSFIITYAADHNGFVVSNDMFRNHIAAQTPEARPHARAWVKSRVIPYTFVGREFVPDPHSMRRLLAAAAQHHHRTPPIHLAHTTSTPPLGVASAAAAVTRGGHPGYPATRTGTGRTHATSSSPSATLTPPHGTSHSVRVASTAHSHAHAVTPHATKAHTSAPSTSHTTHVSREARPKQDRKGKDAKVFIVGHVKRLLQPAYTSNIVDKDTFKAIAKMVSDQFVTQFREYACVRPKATVDSWWSEATEAAILRELQIVVAASRK